MSTARTPDGTHGYFTGIGDMTIWHPAVKPEPDPLVKPTSEVAHQPGQQPAAFSCEWCGDPIPADMPDDDFCSDACHWEWSEQTRDDP